MKKSHEDDCYEDDFIDDSELLLEGEKVISVTNSGRCLGMGIFCLEGSAR